MVKKLIVDSGTLYKKAADLPGEGPSFEQQFGILANAQITDKYPMLGNYQISVQLLDKSDDNSFAVCVVVYKLGKNYIYVPAVFRNGKISTGLIMLVPAMQMFLPLSDAWMSWIKKKDDTLSGLLIGSDMKDLYGEAPGTARSKDPNDPFMKTASLKTASIFDTVLKLGKQASLKFMGYLCNNEFLNNTFKFYTPEQIETFAKTATHKFPDDPEVEIISALDKSASLLTEDQKAALYRDGFLVKKALKVDWGPALNAIKAIRKTNIIKAFRAPQGACKCKALTQDGLLVDIVYIPVTDKGLLDWERGLLYPHRAQWGELKWYSPAKNMMRNGKAKAITADNKIWKDIDDQITALESSIEDLDVSSLGQSFADMDKSVLPIVVLTPKKEAYKLFGYDWKKNTLTGLIYSYKQAIALSKDLNLKKPVFSDNYIEFPKGSRILLSACSYTPSGLFFDRYDDKKNAEQRLKNDTKVFLKIGDLGKALLKFMQKNYKKIKATSDGQLISFSGLLSDASKRMQKTLAVLHLVKDYGISPQDAKVIVKLAGSGTLIKPQTLTYYLYKESALGQLSDDYVPADIGYTEVPNVPPEQTTVDLNNMPQDDSQLLLIINRAALAGVKEVFDTATLKMLVSLADPHQLILDALPDFMKTLDKLCRILFIYRCHMLDMLERYGAVKMKALLKSLTNTITDLSLLTIFLKLRGLNNGEAPDAGDLQTGTLMQ